MAGNDACLAGVSVNGVVKQAGMKFGVKMAEKAIEKIPGKALVKINQKIGFRFITKFGEKGIINLGKMVPGVGAVINGGLDFAETRMIADRAYKMFFEGDFSAGQTDDDTEEMVIDETIENDQEQKEESEEIRNSVMDESDIVVKSRNKATIPPKLASYYDKIKNRPKKNRT